MPHAGFSISPEPVANGFWIARRFRRLTGRELGRTGSSIRLGRARLEGIEPQTPVFSGLLSNRAKRFRINQSFEIKCVRKTRLYCLDKDGHSAKRGGRRSEASQLQETKPRRWRVAYVEQMSAFCRFDDLLSI